MSEGTRKKMKASSSRSSTSVNTHNLNENRSNSDVDNNFIFDVVYLVALEWCDVNIGSTTCEWMVAIVTNISNQYLYLYAATEFNSRRSIHSTAMHCKSNGCILIKSSCVYSTRCRSHFNEILPNACPSNSNNKKPVLKIFHQTRSKEALLQMIHRQFLYTCRFILIHEYAHSLTHTHTQIMFCGAARAQWRNVKSRLIGTEMVYILLFLRHAQKFALLFP